MPLTRLISIPLLAAAAIAPALAQPASYPTKPIRMIVSSGSGGGLDLVARVVTAPMIEKLGQSVVVDNRAGASGSIAAELTAAAPADGYTLMLLSASLVVYGVANKTRYDLYRDFAPVGQLAASPYLLTVHPAMPVRSVKDLIAYAKANPGKLNFASTGTASLAHLSGELFGLSTGTQLVHVPYKGVGAALTDMLSGQVQMSFLSGGSVASQVRTQKLRALAVANPQRSKTMPDLPTMIESGVPGFIVTQWHGLLAPQATPRPVIDRLNREMVRAVHLPEVVARLGQDGTEPVGSSPEQFGKFLAAERDQWARAAKAANITAE